MPRDIFRPERSGRTRQSMEGEGEQMDFSFRQTKMVDLPLYADATSP